MPKQQPSSMNVDREFPRVSAWIYGGGMIEFGSDDCRDSEIRILDLGGQFWESTEKYESLSDMLAAAEQALADLEDEGTIDKLVS